MDQDNQDQSPKSNEPPEVEGELVDAESAEPFTDLAVSNPAPIEPTLPSTDHLPFLDFGSLNMAEIKIDKVSQFEPLIRRFIEVQGTRVFAKVEDELAKGKQDKNTYNEIKAVMEMIKLYKDISTPVDQLTIKSTGHGGRNVLEQFMKRILESKKDDE